MPLQSTIKEHRTKTNRASNRHGAVEQRKLQQAIDKAERGIEEGRWVEHAEVEAKLKRWAGTTA